MSGLELLVLVVLFSGVITLFGGWRFIINMLGGILGLIVIGFFLGIGIYLFNLILK